jgi:hypothetical protein
MRAAADVVNWPKIVVCAFINNQEGEMQNAAAPIFNLQRGK